MADPYTYRRTSLSVHGLQEALDSHDRITKGNYDSGNNTTSHSNNYFNNHNINNNSSSSNNNNTHHSYRDDDNDDRNRREYNNGYNDTSKGRGGDNNNDYSNAAARDHNGDNRLARRDDEREKDDDGNERKSDSRGNKTHRGKPKGESVRKRYYDTSEMEDVLQDKIATQLRENGIAETKVVTLSAKISQAVRDDVIDSENGRQPQVTANLTEAINKHLDPMLYNRDDATDLRDSQKPRDAIHLSNLVLLRLGQIHEEVDQAKRSSEDLQKTARKNKEAGGRTPRDEQSDRSQIMAIKENIEKGKTERDILAEKLRQAQRETEDVEDDKYQKQKEVQDLDAENYSLRHELQTTEQDKQSLLTKVREMQRDYDRLDKTNTQIRGENQKLKRQIEEYETTGRQMAQDLSRLQSDRARLQVLVDQKDKEIVHLRDPDKDMTHNLKVLNEEVTMLRTQTRRLHEEKGLLKSRSQKIESTLDESQKVKNKMMVERDALFKENQELKQRYRKLALSNPKQRTLPDILSGSNGPSSRAGSRANSRIRNSDDSRLSPAREEEEDKYYR